MLSSHSPHLPHKVSRTRSKEGKSFSQSQVLLHMGHQLFFLCSTHACVVSVHSGQVDSHSLPASAPRWEAQASGCPSIPPVMPRDWAEGAIREGSQMSRFAQDNLSLQLLSWHNFTLKSTQIQTYSLHISKQGFSTSARLALSWTTLLQRSCPVKCRRLSSPAPLASTHWKPEAPPYYDNQKCLLGVKNHPIVKNCFKEKRVTVLCSLDLQEYEVRCEPSPPQSTNLRVKSTEINAKDAKTEN